MAIPKETIVDFDAAGLAGLTGPLSKLYENPFKFETYSYPRNLGGDPTRKHVIEFVAMVPAPNQSPTGNLIETLYEGGKNAIQTSVDAGKLLFEGEGAKALTLIGQAAQKSGPAFEKLTAADVVRIPGTTIRLYVPDTVNVQYSAAYDDLSLAGVLGTPYFIAQAGVSLFDKYRNSSGGFDVSKMVNAVGDDPYIRKFIGDLAESKGILGRDAGAFLTSAVGQALNPQMQVIFRSIGFRSHQFDFTLTPYSQEEAIQIKKIVESFKMAAAPEVQASSIFGKGLFFKVPDRFNIRFLYNGRRNENIHRIAECVLQNIAVDYAPMGWATFGDGNPVQTKLTLQFQEIEIIDKTRIKEGY